jgi:glycosyltransferase A (GT-A) superfamily protein (DUF2064 family)
MKYQICNKDVPMYARDLGFLLVNNTTGDFMVHPMFLQAINNGDVVVCEDTLGPIPALSPDFNKLYRLVDMDEVEAIDE